LSFVFYNTVYAQDGSGSAMWGYYVLYMYVTYVDIENGVFLLWMNINWYFMRGYYIMLLNI